MKEGYPRPPVVSHLASHLTTPYCTEAWEVWSLFLRRKVVVVWSLSRVRRFVTP